MRYLHAKCTCRVTGSPKHQNETLHEARQTWKFHFDIANHSIKYLIELFGEGCLEKNSRNSALTAPESGHGNLRIVSSVLPLNSITGTFLPIVRPRGVVSSPFADEQRNTLASSPAVEGCNLGWKYVESCAY